MVTFLCILYFEHSLHYPVFLLMPQFLQLTCLRFVFLNFHYIICIYVCLCGCMYLHSVYVHMCSICDCRQCGHVCVQRSLSSFSLGTHNPDACRCLGLLCLPPISQVAALGSWMLTLLQLCKAPGTQTLSSHVNLRHGALFTTLCVHIVLRLGSANGRKHLSELG